MLVLAYLGILALIPLLVEKDDEEVQWHSKQGLLLFAGWIVLYIALAILSLVPVVGTVLGCAAAFLVPIVALVVHILCIVKAVGGERLRIPFVADFADQWR
jgi:uncharacterized membrane protein